MMLFTNDPLRKVNVFYKTDVQNSKIQKNIKPYKSFLKHLEGSTEPYGPCADTFVNKLSHSSAMWSFLCDVKAMAIQKIPPYKRVRPLHMDFQINTLRNLSIWTEKSKDSLNLIKIEIKI
jgi:hypothetical protein